LAEWAASEYLAQTSTIAYRAERLRDIRFSETLRLAGEDHIFFVDLALAATHASFSLGCEIERGAGVNIYERAQTWGDPRDLDRRIYNLGTLRLLRRRASWSTATRLRINQQIAQARQIIGFLLLRHSWKARKLPTEALRLTWRRDKASILLAPINAARFAFKHWSAGKHG
jgi:succinoglycan biosynthesis protein ExoW